MYIDETFQDRTHHLAGVMIYTVWSVSWLQFQNGEDLLITVHAGDEQGFVPNENIRFVTPEQRRLSQ
jgi:hypothetical protein